MPDSEREELLREALHAMHHWPVRASEPARTRELLVVTLEGELSLAMLFSDRHDERCELVLDAEARVRELIAAEPRGRGFGNARFVRNLFETAVAHQAMRLAPLDDPSDEQLTTFIAVDIAPVDA